MITITPNPTVQKSFVVGRPINATVSLEDVVTVNITLVDENEDAVNLTSCTVQASTVDTIGHLWGTVVTDAAHGKFQFTFQPLVVGRTELYAMVTKNNGVGQDETTTTFYLGDFSVAYGEQTPQAHIISLTAQLQQAATDANNAAASATSAASSATSAASTATSAATSATTAAGTANSAATSATTAATSATNAASSATSAATSATNAASSATSAATSANTAADRADDAAEVIEAASITVGTVVSGATPSITNVGSGVNPIFNFVLPKGDKGEPGDATIDDSSTAVNRVWSASKVNGLIGNVESLLEALL